MNSFLVERGREKPVNTRRFSRIVTSIVALSAALLIGSVTALSSGTSITGFAQNLPKPQQVLGSNTAGAYCKGMAYQNPSAVVLDDKEAGLHYAEGTPQFYSLYGTSIADLRQAISGCEVRKQAGDYHALTSYTINWQFDTQVSAGQCTLANVKVGMATNQYLPRLAENQVLSAEDGLTWNSYYSHLVEHENEHLALNKKHAANLHASLSSVAASCDSIDSTASTVIRAQLQMLKSAHILLDSQTNHGADAGAIL